jgi:ketosteroid isomerase-like protein
MTSPSESADSNAALVLESIEALNAGDTERLLAVVAPDIVIHYTEMPEPRDLATGLRAHATRVPRPRRTR